MNKVCKKLTRYIVSRDLIDKNDEGLYEYAFVIAFEIALFALTCILIVSFLDMYKEGVLFFFVFAPLRSYAGGLHMKKYVSCYFLSCVTFSTVLFAVKVCKIPALISFFSLIFSAIIVYNLSPVDNDNRKVDEEEDIIYKKRLLRFLIIDVAVGMLCFVLKKERYLLNISLTFFVVVVTMAVGKYSNQKLKKI